MRSVITRADRTEGGLVLDVGLYGLSAAFAWWTVAVSTLAPHRAWGTVAWVGYAVAAGLAAVQLAGRRLSLAPSWSTGPIARLALAAGAWVATAFVPLVLQAWQRAGGRTDRAQEEVLVIEAGAQRLLETGTPYANRSAIAALPADERLLAYMPYQPGMAAFGLPRALDPGAAWWSDARVWFAAATAAALVAGLVLLARAGTAAGPLVRALQIATVVPLTALTLATGGDDLPVLALCLLAFAFAAADRHGAAGLAVGAAAALKLFAWPVALVLAVHATTRRRAGRFAVAVLALPVATLVPVVLVDPAAVVENVLAYPFGRGLVTSPAASPLPGHLLANGVPGGRTIALGLLLLAGAAIAVWLLRRPPRTAAAAAAVCATGLLAAMLLLPATRFGYLLYPAAFAVWAAALTRTPEATPDA